MTEKEIKIGFDRFLALNWANYSMELFLSDGDPAIKYKHLKDYIHNEVAGTESARKTVDQLRRLWLDEDDEHAFLRELARKSHQQYFVQSNPIYHFGMAINVFPVFYFTCRKIGELSRIQDEFNALTIVNRVSNEFLNPSSIPRIVNRIIQTLIDWGFITRNDSRYKLNEITGVDKFTLIWLIRAFLSVEKSDGIPLADLSVLPTKIGIDIGNIREVIKGSEGMAIKRGIANKEYVVLEG